MSVIKLKVGRIKGDKVFAKRSLNKQFFVHFFFEEDLPCLTLAIIEEVRITLLWLIPTKHLTMIR